MRNPQKLNNKNKNKNIGCIKILRMGIFEQMRFIKPVYLSAKYVFYMENFGKTWLFYVVRKIPQVFLNLRKNITLSMYKSCSLEMEQDKKVLNWHAIIFIIFPWLAKKYGQIHKPQEIRNLNSDRAGLTSTVNDIIIKDWDIDPRHLVDHIILSRVERLLLSSFSTYLDVLNALYSCPS